MKLKFYTFQIIDGENELFVGVLAEKLSNAVKCIEQTYPDYEILNNWTDAAEVIIGADCSIEPFGCNEPKNTMEGVDD